MQAAVMPEGKAVPLEQADVGEEGLSILVQDVQGVAQHLLPAALAQDVLRHRHLRPEVEGHGRLPQGCCVGSPETGQSELGSARTESTKFNVVLRDVLPHSCQTPPSSAQHHKAVSDTFPQHIGSAVPPQLQRIQGGVLVLL